MSDEKDPVMQKIERDAREWWENEGGPDYDPDGAHEDSFMDGATKQDPIAWNRCLDAVKEMATRQQDEEYDNEGYSALERLKKNIEKLRR